MLKRLAAVAIALALGAVALTRELPREDGSTAVARELPREDGTSSLA